MPTASPPGPVSKDADRRIRHDDTGDSGSRPRGKNSRCTGKQRDPHPRSVGHVRLAVPPGKHGGHPGRKRRGYGRRQGAHQRRDAGPAGPDRGAHRSHGPGHSGGGRPAGPGGPGAETGGAPQRAGDRKDRRAHGRDRHHLREPPQRDQRRRRPCHQERQCLHPALRQRGLAQRQCHRESAAAGSCGERPAGSRCQPDRGHLPRLGQRPDDRRGLCGPADPPRRGRADPRLRGKRQGPLHPDRHRHLPHFCG